MSDSLPRRMITMLFCSLLLCAFAMGPGISRALAQQNQCDSTVVYAVRQANDSCYISFVAEKYNRAYTARSLKMTVLSQGVTVNYATSSAPVTTASYSSSVVNWSFGSMQGGGLTAGAADGLHVRFNTSTNGTFYVLFEWYDAQSQRRCVDTVAVTCSTAVRRCFSTAALYRECTVVPGSNQIRYTYSLNMTNNTSWQGRHLALAVLSPANVTATPAGQVISVAPGASRNGLYTFTLSGNGATPGATVRLTARYCDTLTNNCCTDTFTVVIPQRADCGQNSGCVSLSDVSITCDSSGRGYLLCFRVQNRSNNAIRYLLMSAYGPGISAPGIQTSFTPPLAPGATSFRMCALVPASSFRGGALELILRACDSLQRCCSDSLTLKLPTCDSTQGCMRIVSKTARCDSAMGNRGIYRFCFNVQNLSGVAATRMVITSSLGSSTNFNLSPAVSGNGGLTGEKCFTVVGTQGTTVGFAITLRDSLGRVICVDSSSLVLPPCGPQPGGCLTLTSSTIECNQDSLRGGYLWCFRVQNNSSRPASFLYLTPVSPQGTFVIPGTVTLNPQPLQPGMTSSLICVNIQNNGQLQPGTLLTVLVRMCDSTLQYCCLDTIELRVPDCGGHARDCCAGFKKSFTRVSTSASSSGYASMGGWLSAGPAAIKSVSATVVTATVNGQPVYGYFNSGILYNALGAGIVVPPPYGTELAWGPNAMGVNMNAQQQFYLSMKFPAMAPNLKRDTLRFCVKFRYTDVNCVTCDTTICFTRVRYRFNNGGTGEAVPEKGDGGLMGTPTISGMLGADNHGSMIVVLPNAPAELGPITYVGMRIKSEEVGLASVTATDPSFVFTMADGWATTSFTATAGTGLNLDLAYNGLGDRQSLMHRVVLLYSLGHEPTEVMEEEYEVTLRREGSMERKDVVESKPAGVPGTWTFALHLKNDNGAGEKIARLRLSTDGEARVVAVGPTANDFQTVLEFGRDGDRPFVGEVTEGANVMLSSGQSHGPIYVTLTNVSGNVATVLFTTLDANGQPVSDGEVQLTNPAASAVTGDGHASGTTMLRQSYPNPAAHSATIQFALPGTQSGVSLVVTDATGAEVARLIDGASLNAGQHVVHFDTQGLASGTYYYTLRAGDRSETLSMRVVK